MLHDIAGSKFHDGDETIGPMKAAAFLKSINLENSIIEHVVNIYHQAHILRGWKSSPNV